MQRSDNYSQKYPLTSTTFLMKDIPWPAWAGEPLPPPLEVW